MTTLHFLKDPEDTTTVLDTEPPYVAFFRKAARVLGWILIPLSGLGLIDCILGGYPGGVHVHASGNFFPHQSLTTLISFLMIGIGVLSVHAAPLVTRWLQSGFGAAVILMGTISTQRSVENSWQHDELSAWVMLLLGFSLAAGGSRLPIIGYVRQSALFVVFILCGLVVVGHAYEIPGETTYLNEYLHLPWTSALMGIIAGHGLLFQHPNFGVMRLISGEGFGCHIMRRLLPSVILLLLVLGGLLAFGEGQDWYPPAFGESLYAILAVTGFSGILLFTAASLNRIDGERHAREEDLRRSQSQLQAVLDQIPSIICIKSPAERYLMVNRQFVVGTGLTAGECIGRTVSEVMSQPAAAVVQRGFKEALITQSAVSSVEMLPMHDGVTHTYLSAHFPLLNGQGEAYAVCGVYTDITDIKRQEEEIRSLNHSLQEKTLRQEAANAELEAFSYSVSHDLRAPLRHIAGFGKLLGQRNAGNLDEKSLHYLNVIETSVGRMGALIDDLLSFSRASKVELSARRVNTAELVTEIRAELAAQRPDRSVTWEIKDLPTTYGDPAMLRLVWMNLLSNAVKYSSKNPAAHVTVDFTPASDAGPGVFSVRDNGAGFDMRYADKLFGVFQRLHSNQEYEGTGIGLAMVSRILERHGGKIWAEAAPGEGACFYFVLPDRPNDGTVLESGAGQVGDVKGVLS
jgi:PAS domain S-box-containing protein